MFSSNKTLSVLQLQTQQMFRLSFLFVLALAVLLALTVSY